MKVDERGFEDAITASLVEHGGYRVCKRGTATEWAAEPCSRSGRISCYWLTTDP